LNDEQITSAHCSTARFSSPRSAQIHRPLRTRLRLMRTHSAGFKIIGRIPPQQIKYFLRGLGHYRLGNIEPALRAASICRYLFRASSAAAPSGQPKPRLHQRHVAAQIERFVV
jgi:hypothetical protein